MGTLRNGWEGGGRRILVMRWKERRSTVGMESAKIDLFAEVQWIILSSPSCTEFQRPEESSLERLIIPFAVPFRRKSASLTLLIKASFITTPSASSRTSSSSGQSLKCTVNRQGSVESLGFSGSQIFPSLTPLDDAGSASAYRSYRSPTG